MIIKLSIEDYSPEEGEQVMMIETYLDFATIIKYPAENRMTFNIPNLKLDISTKNKDVK